MMALIVLGTLVVQFILIGLFPITRVLWGKQISLVIQPLVQGKTFPKIAPSIRIKLSKIICMMFSLTFYIPKYILPYKSQF